MEKHERQYIELVLEALSAGSDRQQFQNQFFFPLNGCFPLYCGYRCEMFGRAMNWSWLITRTNAVSSAAGMTCLPKSRSTSTVFQQ